MWTRSWRDVELVAELDAEGSVPRVDIADDSIDAVLARGVRIAHDLLAHESFVKFTAPNLSQRRKTRWSRESPSITSAGLPLSE